VSLCVFRAPLRVIVFNLWGLNGQSKVSKILKTRNLSLIEKENTWLLLSEETIVLVIGNRQDERFKITKHNPTYHTNRIYPMKKQLFLFFAFSHS
jgi:hypothetical protein